MSRELAGALDLTRSRVEKKHPPAAALAQGDIKSEALGDFVGIRNL
jgi:hypothetical protein